MNVVGRVNAEQGENRRNENIQFNLVDNNAANEQMVRIGLTATVVEEFKADRTYFGAEFGHEPPAPIHLRLGQRAPLHGTLRYLHNNSIFNARSFFQVGGVQPARENSYGFNLTAPAWRGAWFTVDGSQRKLRGSVNGNVLVPTPDERTPLTTDPVLLPIVTRYLGAYPNQLPNRTDINSRMLNTNAPQVVNHSLSGIRLDQNVGRLDRLHLATNSACRR